MTARQKIVAEMDQQIHQLAQTIAKFNRSYALKKADDSHTNMAFDPIGMRMLGRWVESSGEPIILALNLADFKFEIFSKSWQKLHSIELNGKTQPQAEEAIISCLPGLGLDAQHFMAPLHYEIPEYAFANAPYSPWKDSDLAIWAAHRSMANDACQWLLNHLQTAGEIRIWPHHFDTGIYVEPTPKVGLGFGLAMQDSLVETPYFYFSGYGLNGHKIDYGSTKTLTHGYWIKTESFKSAILELSDNNRETLPGFIKSVASWYLDC